MLNKAEGLYVKFVSDLHQLIKSTKIIIHSSLFQLLHVIMTLRILEANGKESSLEIPTNTIK